MPEVPFSPPSSEEASLRRPAPSDEVAVAVHDLSAGTDAIERVSELALRCLPEWPDAEGSTLRLLAVSENATFAVDGPAGRTVLRVHRLGYHDRGAIESELAWLTALRAGAIVRTPRVITARDGRAVVEVADGVGGSRSCVMFEHLPGTEPGQGDGSAFEYLGELTARLHQHAAGWSPPRGFHRFTWDVDTTIGPLGRWGRWQDGPGVGPEERALLSRLTTRLRDRLDGYGRAPDRFGLIHADLRLANLLVDDGGATSVIDFDDCGFGWRLYDLAAALSFFEDDPAVPDLIGRWLTGYRRVRAVAAADEAEIWTFVLLRRLLLLAWIGSHPAADEAHRLGDRFATGTCELAERYLSNGPMSPVPSPR